MALFRDRHEGGKTLGNHLIAYKGKKNVLVLALPRGGVVVGYEIAKALKLPLDVLLVRKLGVPGYEELAFGAIAMGGVEVYNQEVLSSLHVTQSQRQAVIEKEKEELQRREQVYRKNKPALEVKDKTIIVVDDGLATGATMRAAINALKHMDAGKIIVAVPVSAVDTRDTIASMVDEVICLETPEPFYGIGMWYDSFPQNTDDEVLELLSSR